MSVNDMMIVTGNEDASSELEWALALQRQINNGTVWHFEGAVGRAAMAAIENGLVMVGEKPHSDYYQNTVPSRSMLLAGSQGTYEFVKERKGQEWADALLKADEHEPSKS